MSLRQGDGRSEPDRHGRRGDAERPAGAQHKERRRTPPRGSSDRANQHEPKRRRLSPSDPDYRREHHRGDPPSRPHHSRSSPSRQHGREGPDPQPADKAAGSDRHQHHERHAKNGASSTARHHSTADRDRSRDCHRRDRDSGRDRDRDGASGRRDKGSAQRQADGGRRRSKDCADAEAREQQQPAEIPAEQEAPAMKSTVHDYDYIVPTGGRHYEHDDRDVVTFEEERGRHGGSGPKILYDDGPMRPHPGGGHGGGWGRQQPWGGRAGVGRHEGPTSNPRFTADSMQSSRGPPRQARGGGFGPADGKWSHDKFGELYDATAPVTAAP